MSSGAEPEDLDPGCGGKTNAGSPEKKRTLLLQFSKFIFRKHLNVNSEAKPSWSGFSSTLIFLFTLAEGHWSCLHFSLQKNQKFSKTPIFGNFWGIFWGIFWEFSRVQKIRGILWELFEDVWLRGSDLGIFWEFFGNSLGILWEFYQNSLGILSEFFGNYIRIL